MKQRATREWRALLVAATVAIVVHLQLLLSGLLPWLFGIFLQIFPPPPNEQVTEVALLSIPAAQYAENQRIRPRGAERPEEENKSAQGREEKKPAEREKEPAKDEELPERGQVVDVAPTPDNTPPKNARFLSEHNTNVEREMVSRDSRPDYGVAQPRPTMAAGARFRGQDGAPDEKGRDRVAVLMQKRGAKKPDSSDRELAFEIPNLSRRDPLPLKLDLDTGDLLAYTATSEVRGNSDRLKIQTGRAGAGKSEAGDGGKDESTVAMLRAPSLDQLDLVTGAPSNDYIEDVPRGDQTMLNSREFKYATFFNRVKRGVSQQWSPRVAEEYIRHDPYGNIYGVKDRHTLLNIALNASGELVTVTVAETSGVDFFDDVAMQSFRDASPFPNPPPGLLARDGVIRFQFGFYFMIGERPMIRPFQIEQRPY